MWHCLYLPSQAFGCVLILLSWLSLFLAVDIMLLSAFLRPQLLCAFLFEQTSSLQHFLSWHLVHIKPNFSISLPSYAAVPVPATRHGHYCLFCGWLLSPCRVSITTFGGFLLFCSSSLIYLFLLRYITIYFVECGICS